MFSQHALISSSVITAAIIAITAFVIINATNPQRAHSSPIVPNNLQRQTNQASPISITTSDQGTGPQHPQDQSTINSRDNFARSLRAIHGANSWHQAGFTGTGINVGLIDPDLQGLQERITQHERASQPRYHCFASETSTIATTNHEDCEAQMDEPDGGAHGTQVAQAVFDVARDIQLYVSNASTRDQIKNAVEWFNAQNVHIIVYSQTWPWDGAGDGSSPYVITGDDPSPLNILNYAVTNGIIWIQGAGNTGEGSWYSSTLSFSTANQRLIFDNRDGISYECNDIIRPFNEDGTIKPFAHKDEISVYLRWQDSWPDGTPNSGASINIDVELHTTDGLNTTRVKNSDSAQSGGSDHYPLESLTHEVSQAQAGKDFCVIVKKTSSGPDPTWIQIAYNGEFNSHTTGWGITNPAESNNPGMLAVGGTSENPPEVANYSAKGPTPDGRAKPDVVAHGKHRAIDPGTSYAAPHVAGLAALIIQSLGHLDEFDEPHEVANYLRDTAVQHGSPDPNNNWGYGFAYLPQPQTPTGVVLSHNMCTAENKLRLDFEPNWIVTPRPPNNVQYQIELTDTDSEETYFHYLRTSQADLTAFEGRTYQATARTCYGITCTDSSTPSAEFTIPSDELCQPYGLAARPRNMAAKALE